MTEKLGAEILEERAASILRILIREFVRTNKPVGSRRLAKIHDEELSPATIRNVVADLEETGFVTQPHTSAGRVPTAKGYRFYVDSLAETQSLPDEDVDRIRQSLGEESDPDTLMNKASQLLSALSNNVGFVLAPPLSMTVMRHIEFVKIAGRRVLVILVAKTGLVQHRILRLEDELPQSELDQASRYLVHNFEGKSLSEIRDELIKLMSEEKALYDRMLQNVILLGNASLMREGDDADAESEVYLGGTARIIDKPELADVNRMMTLFQTFEEKSRLVRILNECVRCDQRRPTVTIGLEKHIPGMMDLALISSPYSYDRGVTGTLGILGPSRMEYEKAISLVDYVAKLFGQLLANNNKRH